MMMNNETTASQPILMAYVATDLDGHADVGLTIESAKYRAGPGCDTIIALHDISAQFVELEGKRVCEPGDVLASQPKSIGDDAQGEIRKVHHLKTDPEVFDAVARGMKTHEIRLNDRDFQIGDRLVLAETESTGAAMRSAPKIYPLVYTGRTESRIVSHIQTGYGLADGWCILSFRAPADQASATIQAAPRLSGDKIFDIASSYFVWTLNDAHCDSWKKATQGIIGMPNLLAFAKAIQDAATIQEPLMVAEPVGEGQAQTSAAFPLMRAAFETSESGPDGYFIKFKFPTLVAMQKAHIEWIAAQLADSTTLAAPMVADPAGVALTYPCWSCKKPYTLDQRSYADGRCPHCDVDIDLELDDEADAATVKAVPSEAMREVGSVTLAKWGDEEWEVAWRGEISKLMDGLYYTQYKVGDTVKLYAAPLADTTGGGE